MGFSDYKKNRTKVNELVDKKIESLSANPFQDDRFWELSVDQLGNGSAVIRFLPSQGDETPFVQIFDHAFQGPGGWYMERCLTTARATGKMVGQCPVCADNSELWNSGIPDNKKIVSGDDVNKVPGRKRKLSYISNILVVKDPKKPENNGKVFLFKYGAQIYEILQSARTPAIEDELAINPFDMFEGANFNLIAKIDKGYRSYKSSKFSAPSPVDKSEKKMEEVFNAVFSVYEFIADNKFKTDADLETRFNKVLGNSKRVPALTEDEPTVPEPRTKTRRGKVEKEDEPPFEVGDDNDNLAKFKQMAED